MYVRRERGGTSRRLGSSIDLGRVKKGKGKVQKEGWKGWRGGRVVGKERRVAKKETKKMI